MRDIHGAKKSGRFQHLVFDREHWERLFALEQGQHPSLGWIDSPGDLALREQAIRVALAHGDLGATTSADVFVWAESVGGDSPWLTRIGGVPWRPKERAWPKDPDGVPLTFLGQINFGDSKHLVPFELPGEVALIFGTASSGWISIDRGSALEWSPQVLTDPCTLSDIPWTGALPFEYHGVLHRTEQYTDWEKSVEVFQRTGDKRGGSGLAAMQVTQIGTYADLPQDWPFEEGDGNTLIAVLSSFYFRGRWPLCDVPRCLQRVRSDGSAYDMISDSGREFGVGDAGCIWIYRDREGRFAIDSAYG